MTSPYVEGVPPVYMALHICLLEIVLPIIGKREVLVYLEATLDS